MKKLHVVTPAWTLINAQSCCGEKNYMVFSYIAFFRIVLHFLCFHPTPISRQNHRTVTENETSAQKCWEFTFFGNVKIGYPLQCAALYILSNYNAYFSSVATLVLDNLKIKLLSFRFVVQDIVTSGTMNWQCVRLCVKLVTCCRVLRQLQSCALEHRANEM
jgi:hypothetical protein